jgi:sterol desaturase/sphingolipid hydroxylase (fatty acid hydroxylase superfamily)
MHILAAYNVLQIHRTQELELASFFGSESFSNIGFVIFSPASSFTASLIMCGITGTAACRYHSLHHSRVHTNFALFMPIYDYLGGTVDASSDELHASVREGQ